MLLTLEVTGPLGAALGAQRRKVFRDAGGTIGRQPDRTWVLADSYVSRRHALVRYVNGTFYIEDDGSASGVFINSPENRLATGQAHALESGDRVFIEPYELTVSITEDPRVAAAPLAARDPFAASDERAPAGARLGTGPAGARLGTGPAGIPSDELLTGPGGAELLEMLGGGVPHQPRPSAPRAANLASGSILREHYTPPQVVAPTPPASLSEGLIPDNWDLDVLPGSKPSKAPSESPDRHQARPQSPAPVERPVVAQPVRPLAAPAQGPRSVDAPGGADLATLLAEAGFAGVEPTPELARDLGRILRVVVSGVIDVLNARQHTKDEFRVTPTRYQRAGHNNPFKFSTGVDDALHKLLVQRDPAFLGPVDAFEDAFHDIRSHQMAMLEGMRVAFEAMFAAFSPERLQQQFDAQIKKGLIKRMPAKLAKMEYWDLYCAWIHDMVRDTEGTFGTLFGEEFASAYEEQLRRLKSQRRAGGRALGDRLEP